MLVLTRASQKRRVEVCLLLYSPLIHVLVPVGSLAFIHVLAYGTGDREHSPGICMYVLNNIIHIYALKNFI